MFFAMFLPSSKEKFIMGLSKESELQMEWVLEIM